MRAVWLVVVMLAGCTQRPGVSLDDKWLCTKIAAYDEELFTVAGGHAIPYQKRVVGCVQWTRTEIK